MDSYVCHSIDEVDENILIYPKYRDNHSIRGSKGLFERQKEGSRATELSHRIGNVYHPELAYSSCSIFDRTIRECAVEFNSEEICRIKDQRLDGIVTVKNFEKSSDVFQRLVNDAEARKMKGNRISQLKHAHSYRSATKNHLSENLWANIQNSALKRKQFPNKKIKAKLEIEYDKRIIDSMLFNSNTPRQKHRRSPIRLRHLKINEIADFRETELHSRLSTQVSHR